METIKLQHSPDAGQEGGVNNEELSAEKFFEFRSVSAKEINDRICEKFMTNGVIEQDAISEIFGNDPEVIKRIVFVLQSFAKPKDADKARRKDGSHIATHSLQLFRTAQDFYQIANKDVGRAVLVHDLVEDTQTTPEDITKTLGQLDTDLAGFMTEEELDEESKTKAGSDAGVLSIARFVHKLKQGGETIALAEILDRIDDVSDLVYITKKLNAPETREKAKRALVEKFAKCSFTIDSLVNEKSSIEVTRMKDSFYQLLDLQKRKIEKEFNIVIDQMAVDKEKSKYLAFYNQQ